ncbi:alpha/beta hydrolase [Arthrobacter sp. 24S4-2]|uniref:alpha/beta hydrolase n=1 Tax=Arthrobacter sp. 24S4-2 TaxID=2575374 RepID=UPI0010C78E77|nr:alpha/beta hydrolase [Arthrobacter sp. 24S4-2]QCO97928.1 alpha/beta hydrolase [Arthrobacter sp. 24S4-2]
MHKFLFTAESTFDGVVDRSFTLGDIPGVLWSPESPASGAPLMLMGHGGGLNKRAPGLVARARAMAAEHGFHAAAIDVQGHGDRSRTDRDQRWVDEMLRARAAGESLAPSITAYNGSLADRTVPEWQATIDALQALPEVGTDAPIGYMGMTLATTIGIPLAAADARIRAAIFGGVFVYDALLSAAREVSIPIEFLMPLDDPEIDRASGLEIFDAFGSTEKTLLAFPGSHFRVPQTQLDTSFFVRQFERAGMPLA